MLRAWRMRFSPNAVSLASTLTLDLQATNSTQNAQNKMNRNATLYLCPLGFSAFSVRLLFSIIDFLQAFFAQTIAVIRFQIGFCGVSEFHLHAPAVHGMDALECFSATGTGFCHKLFNFNIIKHNWYQLFEFFQKRNSHFAHLRMSGWRGSQSEEMPPFTQVHRHNNFRL